jgi:phosphoribosylanthranilate isomerase
VRTRIKFCGCTSADDALLALRCGADAIGVIFAEESPRRVSMEIARDIAMHVPAFTTLVGVFVDAPSGLIDEARLAGYLPQFSGAEPASEAEAFAEGPYIKTCRPATGTGAATFAGPKQFEAFARPYEHATWMFETHVPGRAGGTGQTFPWKVARQLAGDRPIIISGGLTPANVGDCVRRVRPYAVDVRSGIETGGVKDPEKMRAFVRAVMEADAQT